MRWISTLVLGLTVSQLAHAGRLLGVVNKYDGTASVIETETGKTTTFKVGYLPHEIAFASGKVYVSNYGSAHVRSSDMRDRPGNTLSVAALETPQAVNEINLGPARCAPHGLTPTKDGRHLYITCEGRQEIAVLDTLTDSVMFTIPTNQAGSHLVVVASDESRAYVSNFWLGTVSVIDIPNRKLIKQVFVGRGGEGIGLSADDRSVYVTRVEGDEIVKVDTASLTVTKRQPTPGHSPIRVSPVPSHPEWVLVNNVGTNTVQVLNADDLSLVKEITVGHQPIGQAVSNGDYAYAANMKDNNVSVINLKTMQVETQIGVGNAPDGMAFAP
jgi:YVTN family beta-propeller protein